MRSKIIIIVILLAIVIGMVVFGLATKGPGADIINGDKPLSEDEQISVLENLAVPATGQYESVEEQENLLNELAATSSASSSAPSLTEEEQVNILESLQNK